MKEEVKIQVKELLRLQQFEKDNLCNVQPDYQKEAVRHLNSKIERMRSSNNHLRDWNGELKKEIQAYKELEEARAEEAKQLQEIINELQLDLANHKKENKSFSAPNKVLQMIEAKISKFLKSVNK